MAAGSDLPAGNSSDQNSVGDDGFRETVLGSHLATGVWRQSPGTEEGTFRCGDAFWVMKGTNGKVTCDRGIAREGEDDQ